MIALPPLRRKILRSFSLVMILYGALGVFLLISLMTSSATTPKVLHVNYDSIAAATQMKEAWNALEIPKSYPSKSDPQWRAQFEQALKFEEGNVTEPGEAEIAKKLRADWEIAKKQTGAPAEREFSEVNKLLSDLITVNEKGMFEAAQQNSQWSHVLFLGSIVYFLISLLLGFFLANGLAERLSSPIKSIAEVLHSRPQPGRKLKFPEPNSLELLILTTELKRLWERISESERVNVRELLEEKNKLETVLDSVEDALLVVDEQGNVSHFNKMLLRLIGLEESQIEGQTWNDLPTLNENYLKLRAILRHDMSPAQEIELQVNSIMHQFSARLRQIQGAGHEKKGSLFLLHDITEKRQRERFRAEFVDLLSHELKTPLQSLGTATELLTAQKDTLPDQSQALIETIVEDVERIRAVANEFIQVTQSHSKILKLKLSMTALNQVLPEWIKPFKIVAKDRDVKLRFEQEGSEIIWANLDSVKFPWVISNLLSNAIRFSPAGGEVVVLLTDRNGAVEINVKDEGPGVSEEDQRRMFEPFFQSAQVTSTGSKGLFGIGLTIAKEVVEAHDGRIEYFRRQPRGSKFRIVLPFPTGGYT